MRKVVAYELLSLDGVAESPDSFIAEWDEAMDANLAAIIAEQDAVILGRGSYEEWARFWPTSDIEPFATFINEVQKYVATSAPLGSDWANATRIDSDLAAFVDDLRNQSGGEIGVHASISVTQAMLAAGLIDELKVVIARRSLVPDDGCSTVCRRLDSSCSARNPRPADAFSRATASSDRCRWAVARCDSPPTSAVARRCPCSR
jgi:dihydrofolate reductase